MQVTWTNNVRKVLIDKEDERKKQEKKKKPTFLTSKVITGCWHSTVVTNLLSDSSTNVKYTKKIYLWNIVKTAKAFSNT